jgi:hypothetical protein
MAKINIATKNSSLLKIEEMLIRKKVMAGKKLKAWRERNAKTLKKWRGIEIIRSFREKL